jgi:hypothetical protein
MRIALLPSVIALALGTWAGAAPADAQAPVCPPGYYFASDGRCYPGAPPAYPPPVYEYAPPVYQPPVVIDGLILGIGLGALIGGAERGGGYHGGGYHGGGGRGGGRGHR